MTLLLAAVAATVVVVAIALYLVMTTELNHATIEYLDDPEYHDD